MEDLEFFESLNKKIRDLIKVFYNGDVLSDFEKQIERAYLILKNETSIQSILLEQHKQKNKIDCSLTQSEINKLAGLRNFRVNNPIYADCKGPRFDRLEPELMFNTLFEIRYSTLKSMDWFEKIKLKYQYRKSLIELGSEERISFSAKYIFSQIIGYCDSFEFNDEFNLNLNYHLSFNFACVFTWLIRQRLNQIGNQLETDAKLKLACSVLSNALLDQLLGYGQKNLLSFDNLKTKGKRIVDLELLVNKMSDICTFFFHIIPTLASNANTKINNKEACIYSGVPTLLNIIFELGQQSNIIKFNEQIEVLRRPLIVDQIEANLELEIEKNAIVHRKFQINHLSEFVISNFMNLSNRSYYDIEAGDIQLNVDKMSFPYEYNSKILELSDFHLKISETPKALIDTSEYVSAFIAYFGISSDFAEKIVKENSKLFDAPDRSLIDITSNPHECMECHSIEDKKLSLLTRISIFHSNELMISNAVKLEEKKYLENEASKKNEGKELQTKRANSPQLGLNSLVPYRKS